VEASFPLNGYNRHYDQLPSPRGCGGQMLAQQARARLTEPNQVGA